MNVALSSETEKMLQKQLSTGKFGTPEELIREGLRLVAEHQEITELGLDRLRNEVAIGLDQLKSGQFVSGEKAFAELRERSQQYKTRNG